MSVLARKEILVFIQEFEKMTIVQITKRILFFLLIAIAAVSCQPPAVPEETEVVDTEVEKPEDLSIPHPLVDSIFIIPEDWIITSNQSVTLVASFFSADNQPIDAEVVPSLAHWSSSDTSIATVKAQGNSAIVSGFSPGIAIISAEVSGIVGTTSVIVVDVTLMGQVVPQQVIWPPFEGLSQNELMQRLGYICVEWGPRDDDRSSLNNCMEKCKERFKEGIDRDLCELNCKLDPDNLFNPGEGICTEWIRPWLRWVR